MITVTVRNERQNEVIEHDDGPLELGRAPAADHAKLMIEDSFVSRRQLRIEQLSDHLVKVTNLGGPVKLSDDTMIEKGNARELTPPFSIAAGYTTVEVVAPATEVDRSLQTIFSPVQPRENEEELASSSIRTMGDSPSVEKLTQWFQTLLRVQRSAAGSAGFYEETARAVVTLVGLDRGMVLRRREAVWEIVASHARNEGLATGFSRGVLARVVEEKRTFFQSVDEAAPAGASLAHVESVVASPVFDNQEDVVAVVYGSRDVLSSTSRTGVTPLDAQLVQLLAGAVSAGLARQDQEVAGARMRVQFERFASPELARELERNPDLLYGTDREISLIFADMRGFSRLSEELDARETYKLVSDVMNRLTERIRNRGGSIIDYYGDGVAAMWNAPTDQPDHAERACKTAIEIRDELPALNDRWAKVVGRPLDIGIGVNSGMAQVGNAGSRWRLKYGPRGPNVNLASRLEGATKHLGVPILISGATRELVHEKFATRRLCQIAVAGIQQAVEVHELLGESAGSGWLKMRKIYETALELCEHDKLPEAIRILEGLVKDEVGEADEPSALLLERVKEADEAGEKLDPVYRLTGK